MMIKRIVALALLIFLVAILLTLVPMAIADRVSVYEWFDPIVDIRTRSSTTTSNHRTKRPCSGQ